MNSEIFIQIQGLCLQIEGTPFIIEDFVQEEKKTTKVSKLW